MTHTILSNAHVVTRDSSFLGCVVFGPNGIEHIDEGPTAVSAAEDCEGDLLIAGLIEMHTDNVERHMEPRPDVLWPSPISALLQHDAQTAAAGITTAYDAIVVGDHNADGKRDRFLQRTIDAVAYGREHGLFRSEHQVHLRCEVCVKAVVELFEPLAGNPLVRLVSLMDHTPGQRQWWNVEKMRNFHSRRRTYTDQEFESYVRERQDEQMRYAAQHRRQVVDLWRPRGLPMASHDDATHAHVEESASNGVTIAEFPTTLEAATLASERGMANVMGAPNLVRGGSHSGNLSAAALAERGILHALSSDYAPVSLLHGALRLADEHGYTLPDAIATVTLNAAEMLGYDDRGVIERGKRSDLVRVRRLPDGSGAVRTVWRMGQRVS